jgi:hypothetical protein
MAYIKKSRRALIDDHKLEDVGLSMENAGELRYALMSIAISYLGSDLDNLETASSVVSSLNSVANEIQRKYVNPIMDQQQYDNGDI